MTEKVLKIWPLILALSALSYFVTRRVIDYYEFRATQALRYEQLETDITTIKGSIEGLRKDIARKDKIFTDFLSKLIEALPSRKVDGVALEDIRRLDNVCTSE